MHTTLRSVLAVSAAACALAISACSSSTHSSTPSSTSGSGSPSSAAAGTATSGPAAGGTTKCTYTRNGNGSASLPPTTVDPATPYTATMLTSQGDITLSLLTSKAPCTVNSFVHLAKTGFWAGTQCHRISDGQGLYILQCGDPTAKGNVTLSCSGSQGSGGPGYTFADENLTGATYGAGTVAMANSGPNTNGSQFFLVFQTSQLSPAYTPFGTISPSGLAILQKVAKAGTACLYQDGSGVPKDKVVINSVTIAQG